MNLVRIPRILAVLVAAVLIVPVSAYALEGEVIKDAQQPLKEKGGQGWDGTLTLGANISFAHAREVVGQANGQTWAFGLNLQGGLDYIKGMHDWRNSLTFLEGFSYGPPLNRFVKSADKLNFQSIYYFKIPQVPWLGPFARFLLDTTVFEGADNRPAPVTYRITYKNGSTLDLLNKNKMKLADSFLPLTLKEGIGMFARPISLEVFELEARLGFGAQEVFATDQLALNDDLKTTDIVELKELSSFNQAGAEAAIVMQGGLYDKKVNYKLYAEVMTPFIRPKAAGDNRGAFEMTNVEVGAKLSFKLVEWASVDYEFKALRVPQMIDVFQIQNSLLLTFSYTLIKAKPAEPPAPAPAPATAP